MLRYKINVLSALKEKGYSCYKIRKDKIMGEAQVTQIRRGEIVSNNLLDKLCCMLECQPGDLLEYVSNDESNSE